MDKWSGRYCGQLAAKASDTGAVLEAQQRPGGDGPGGPVPAVIPSRRGGRPALGVTGCVARYPGSRGWDDAVLQVLEKLEDQPRQPPGP